MKKLTTFLCCVALAITGFYIAKHGTISVQSQNTLAATPVLDWKVNGLEPVRYIYDRPSDEITDTVYVRDTVQVTNTKYVRVRVPESTIDTIYVPMTTTFEGVSINNKSPGDTVQKSTVVLTIDGKTVYNSDELLKL